MMPPTLRKATPPNEMQMPARIESMMVLRILVDGLFEWRNVYLTKKGDITVVLR
jgi:hypothetical protein